MNTCPACSKTVHPNDLVCPHCGIALHPETPTSAPASGSGMGLSVIVIVVVAVIGIVLILGCLGAAGFFVMARAVPMPAPPPAPVTAPAAIPKAPMVEERKTVPESETPAAQPPVKEARPEDDREAP
jgi:hypothetical protein